MKKHIIFLSLVLLLALVINGCATYKWNDSLNRCQNAKTGIIVKSELCK